MAFTGSLLYLLQQDLGGASNLISVDPLTTSTSSVMSLAPGFNGGLTWRADTGKLYAIQNDGNGTSTLVEIDPAGHTAATQPIVLGQGFYGGLAFDPGVGFYYAIGSDSLANVTLYHFTLADLAPVNDGGISSSCTRRSR